VRERDVLRLLAIERDQLFAGNEAGPRYEAIAATFEIAITSGRLRLGERLPPIRRVAKDLGASAATVMAAYDLLTRRGITRGEVGRGTYVVGLPSNASSGGRHAGGETGTGSMGSRLLMPATVPWRRRTLSTSAARLRAAYPDASDCTSGRSDPALLPLDLMRRAWHTAVDEVHHTDLQYAGPEPLASLVQQLLPRLTLDGVPAHAGDLIVGSSAQQLMVLAVQVVAALDGRGGIVIAVEEPGYPTAFDTFERLGHRLVGFEVDEQGAIPTSLDAALAAGAAAVLFTPRAQNPVGASWSVGRVAELADVLAAHQSVMVLEDDQFAGIAGTRPGSLLADPRIEERVIYIRSFSKSIAPDMRIAIAVARPQLRSLIMEAKSFADGWTSRLAQRALAHLLASDALEAPLAVARDAYAARRAAVARAIADSHAPGCSAWSGADGVNVWVHLPPHVDADEVMERAAALGVLVAPGEPFFIRPGRTDMVRLNAAAVSAERAAVVGRALATAAAQAAQAPMTAISV
jgi:GntR family transcriptional regulator/MocR family aminotransferase